MGFCPSEAKARDIAEVLGQGARHERVDAPFPTDEYVAAREWEARQTVRSIFPLRGDGNGNGNGNGNGKGNGEGGAPAQESTLSLSDDEASEVDDALSMAALADDPWSEDTQVHTHVPAPGQSGFFTPQTQVG